MRNVAEGMVVVAARGIGGAIPAAVASRLGGGAAAPGGSPPILATDGNVLLQAFNWLTSRSSGTSVVSASFNCVTKLSGGTWMPAADGAAAGGNEAVGGGLHSMTATIHLLEAAWYKY